MSADDFFSRWSRKAAESRVPPVPEEDHAVKAPESLVDETGKPADLAIRRPVTLEDVAELTKDSDYSPFVAKGIDETIKRSAMKKLFSDPHFNLMDGLDIYIDDYSVFEPVTPAVLALMEHAKPLLDPLKSMQSTMVSLLQESDAGQGKIPDAHAKQDEAGDSAAAQALIKQEIPEEDEPDGSIEALAQDQKTAETSFHPKPDFRRIGRL